MQSISSNGKPKSVHITNYYHKNSGGISLAYNKLLEAANEHKRFVRLIVPGEKEETEEVGEFGRIYYVPAKFSPVFDKRYRIMLPWKTYIFNSTPIRRILREEQPDIIEIGEKYSLSLLAGLIHKGFFNSLNRPMLVHFSCERMDDNLKAFIGNWFPSKWLAQNFIRNYLFPMFDFHLANSVYTANELTDAVSSVKNNNHPKSDIFNFCWRFFKAGKSNLDERVFVNQCGVDTKLFTNERKSAEKRKLLLAEAGFPENATILLYAGRISPEKNIAFLPKIFNSLVKYANYDDNKNFRLIVAGDGAKADWLVSELEKKTPGKYKFFGHIADKEKLADIFANSDVFIHPNPREPFGIAPLEAMASGIPVIAPNSGGILSYATRENAWLEDAETEDFFAGICDIFRNENRRKEKIANALETSRNYTWKTSTNNLFAQYDKMLEEFRAKPEFYNYKSNENKFDFAKEMSEFS